MRKSLGNKRKQISDEQIADLTRLYGAFEESPRVKIFPNEAFGFLRITVERPLRLRWEITEDTLSVVATDKKIAKLPALSQDLIVEKLRADHGATYHTEKTAKAVVRDVLVAVIGEKPTPLVNAVTAALAVRDPDAPVVTDSKGGPSPTPPCGTSRTYPYPPNGSPTRPTPPYGSTPSNIEPTSTTTSKQKSIPTSPTPGTTRRRRRSATKSPSPATSTPTPHPAPSKRSTPRSERSRPRFRHYSPR